MMDSKSSIIVEEDVKMPVCNVSEKLMTESKATSALPDILSIGISTGYIQQFGIFAKCDISDQTQFGPLDAPLASYTAAKSSPFLLKSQVRKITTTEEPHCNLYYNTSKDKQCNWMCLVRPASCTEEQNMVAHFMRQNVYFTTTRPVLSGEELRVWYAPSYAQFMGEKLLSSKSVMEVAADDKVCNGSVKYLRSRHSRKPPKQTNDAEYLEEKDSVDVRSVPPKKRGWKRAGRLSDQAPTPPVDEQNPLNGRTKTSHGATPPTLDKIVVSVQTGKQAPVSNSRIFLCPECGKSFAKKYTLKNHLTTHSDVFDFVCVTCNKRFKRKDKLHEHTKRMHLHAKRVKKKSKPPRVASKPRFVPRVKPDDYHKFSYKCLQCRLGFHRRGMLINHLLKQHPDIDVASVPEINLPILKEEVAYVCLYCDKSYKSSSKRKLHIQKHHPGQGLPPNKSRHTPYEASGIAKRGMKTLNPVLCPYCRSQYTTKSKMYSHVSNKHPSRFAELNNSRKKKKVEKPKKPKRERSTRIPLPPLTATFALANSSTPLRSSFVNEKDSEMITLFPVPESDFKKSTEKTSLAPPPTRYSRKVHPRGGDRTEDLSNVNKIISMLGDVSSKSYLSDLEETAAATRQICDNNSLEIESTDDSRNSESAEASVSGENEEESLSNSVVATATSYQGDHSIDFMEEITISQDGDKVLEIDETFVDTQSQQEQFVNPNNQPCHDAPDQVCQRESPPRYMRGRKQLLLQAMNEKRMSNSPLANKISRSFRSGVDSRNRNRPSSAIRHLPAGDPGSSAEPHYDVLAPHPRSAQPQTTSPSDLNWIY